MVSMKGKRKHTSGPTLEGSSRKQAKKSVPPVYAKDNLLCKLVRDAGLVLMDGDAPNELDVSKMVFQKQLGQAVKRQVGDLMQTIDTFLKEFGEFIDDTQRFHKSLMPCIFSEKCESIQASSPDSLVRLLLGVEVIQSPFMTLLLEKLQEFIGQDEDFVLYQGQRIYIPRLLLSQFRFLDRVVDGKELTRKLLEVLACSSVEVQKELMACLPDIVEDSEHGEVARQLRSELENNPDLTCPIIDVLTYLNISPDQLVEIRTTVLGMLRSFSIPDLPIVIKFLLESVTSKDAPDVVNDIRSSVVFTASSSLPAEELERIRTGIKLTVEALKGRMQFHRYIAEAWIKAIDAAKNAKVLDFFALLILHWINSKRAVESLVRNKIRAGLLTEDVLGRLFKSHSQVLREYFPSILALAQALLRSPEPPISQTGGCLYKLAFSAFDSYCRQEVVGNLVTHVGSGCRGEIDATLKVLDDLVTDDIKAMSRYAVFVKGVLDYLDHNNLSVAQIGKLYLLLARLAFATRQDTGYLQNDLHIIVRKQLTSDNTRYKRMGIMGAIAIVKTLAARRPDDQQEAGNSGLEKERYKEVVDLMELVQSSTKRDPNVSALFLDTLAGVLAVDSLDVSVEEWIADNMTQTFEETFVTEAVDKTVVPSVKSYGLNDEEESNIAINLLHLVETMYDKSANSQNLSSLSSPVCLAPLFRLVTVCQANLADGNLEEVDALLGCPIFVVRPDDLCERMGRMTRREKDVVCGSLFLTVNWFREVVNSFAPMDSPEMKGKVMLRLKHTTELLALLQKCLAQHPTFTPPAAVFDAERNDAPIPTTTSGRSKTTASDGKKKGGRRKGGKGKKGSKGGHVDVLTEISQRARDEDDDDDDNGGETSQRRARTTHSSQDEGEEGSVTISKRGEETMTSNVNLSDFRLYFRELDFAVFGILKSGRISHADLDSNLNTRETEELQIGLPELQFLLEDLTSKLGHSLTSRGGKRQAFFKSKSEKSEGFSNLDLHPPTQIAKKAVRLLPCLCDHLESSCAFFQHQIEANDGLIDGPGRFTKDGTLTASCYRLLLQSVLSLFSWNGFHSDANSRLLKDALTVVANRIRPSQEQSSTFLSLEDSKRSAFAYFANFADTVPDIETAVTLIRLLTILAGDQKKETGKLAGLAKGFLSREWRGEDGGSGLDLMKGAKFKDSLQEVIKTFVALSAEPLEALEQLASQAMVPLVHADKMGQSEELPSLSRATLPVFYRVILSELVGCVKRVPANRKWQSLEAQEDALLTWSMAVRVLHISISLIKVFNSRSNLAAAIRYGRQFVESFLRVGMPLLDQTFRRHHTIVEKLLKSLQQSTRMLHHMCGHSKIVKDVALTNQVPMLKRALEAFVYRVKAMLTLNSCQEAFWIGNLKNKNLQGEEILTQTSTSTSDANDEGDGEEDKGESSDDDNQTNDGDPEDDESEVEMEEEEEGRGAGGQRSQDDGGSYSDAY